MVAEFHVKADPDKGTFEPVDLHVRMDKRTGDAEVVVEMELESVTMDRENLIELTPKESDSPEPILVFEVRLTEGLLTSSNFEQLIEKPVQVTFRARPKSETPSATPPEPRETKCDVYIDSPGAIHWTLADDPTTRDLPVELDADGTSEFLLSVVYEQWDPEQKKVTYDPDKVEFTHWTGPRLPPDVFGPHPDDLPWEVAGPGNNRDHSRWLSKKELPDPGHPELAPPIESSIRVRVWPRGTIVRHPGKLTFKEGAKLLAEREIPLTLTPARQLVELIRPEEPVPADGQEHELVLRFRRERDQQPVKKGTYSFAFEPGEHHRGGRVTEAEAELTEDANGELTLHYQAPELDYEPGKSFTERLQVYRGTGEKRQLLATLKVHLSPTVRLRIEAEKDGLVWEPYPLTIPAGQAPAVVRGTLMIDVTDKVSGNAVPLQVAHAKVWLFVGPDPGRKIEPALLTGKDGRWEWKLPELAEGVAKLPVERRERTLDPKTERPECRFDDDAEQVITFYEDKMSGYAPWDLFDQPVADQLRRHRVVFGTQLAQNPEHLLARAVSGTELLRSAATYGNSYDDLYDSQMGVAVNGLSGIFTELISWGLNAANIGTKVGGLIGKIAAWLDEVAGSVARGIGRYATTEFATMLRNGCRRIVDFLQWVLDEGMSPTVHDMIEGIIGTFGSIADAAGNLIRREGSALVELVTGALNVLMNLVKALGNLAIAIVLALLEMGGAIIAILMETLGAFLQRCAGEPVERFIAAIGHYLTGRTGPMAERGEWAIGKAFEELYKWVVDKLAATQRFAGGSVSTIGDAVDAMKLVANHAVGWIDGEVEGLRVVDDPDPQIDAFRDTTLSLGRAQATTGKYMSYLEQALAALDAVVLMGECVLMLLGMIFSAGFLNPATLGPALVAFEISFSKLKLMFVRLPALALNLAGAAVIAGAYGVQVWWLPGDAPAPSFQPMGATP